MSLADELREVTTYTYPANGESRKMFYLSILLVLGPDIVQRALAQLAGSQVAPVVFSFGWVAYAFSALLAALGSMYSHGRLSHTDFWRLTSCVHDRLMPEADFSAIVNGVKSGNQRSNRS